MKRFTLLFALAFTVFANAQLTPTLLHGTETNNHFKIYIVADGFTSSQMTTFNNKANDIVDLFTDDLAPFNTNDSKYCIYRVNTISAQSGYDVMNSSGTALSTDKDTYWDLFTNNQNLARYYGFPDSTREKLEDWYGYDSKGEKVFIIFLSNNTNYAGYGDLISYGDAANSNVSIMISSIDPTYMEFLVSHEFGHSFGDLDDEYVDAVYAASSEGSALINNHSNRLNIKDSNPGGWLEGGRYVATGKWRYGNGLMRSASYAFHSRNEQLVEDRINAEDNVKKCPKPSGILTDDAFRRKDGTDGEYHYVIKAGGVYGKYYRNSSFRNCSSYGSMVTLQSWQYYAERTAKANDSNWYQVNDYQDWD